MRWRYISRWNCRKYGKSRYITCKSLYRYKRQIYKRKTQNSQKIKIKKKTKDKYTKDKHTKALKNTKDKFFKVQKILGYESKNRKIQKQIWTKEFVKTIWNPKEKRQYTKIKTTGSFLNYQLFKYKDKSRFARTFL